MVRRRKSKKFRNQIAEKNYDGKDHRGGEPLRDLSRKGTFPNKEKAKHDQWNVYDYIRKKQDIEDTAGIITEDLKESFQRGMRLFQPAQLVRLQGEKRGFETRKERRPED